MIPTSKPVAKRPPAPAAQEQAPRTSPLSGTERVASLDASAHTNRPRPSHQQHKPALALPGTKKTLWQSWLSLRPSMRMALGASVAVFAVLGMAVSDKLQKEYPAPSNSSSSSSSGSATSSSSSSSGGSSASTLTSDDSSAGKPRRFGIRLLDRVETPPTTATNAGGAAPST